MELVPRLLGLLAVGFTLLLAAAITTVLTIRSAPHEGTRVVPFEYTVETREEGLDQ